MMIGVLVTYGTLQPMAVQRLTVLTLLKEEVREKVKERVVRKDQGSMLREFDPADTGSMVIAKRETSALTNMRNVSALLRELQRPHRTTLPRQQQSNLRQLPKLLPRIPPLPRLLVRARARARTRGRDAKARARARKVNIDKHRLVWREFLHQPLVTLT